MCGLRHFSMPSEGHFDETFHASLYDGHTSLHLQVASMDPHNNARQDAMRRREYGAMMFLVFGLFVGWF